MIAVIFEAELAQGQTDVYLRLAAELREELAALDGFQSVERFSSLTAPGKLLSLSFFRDDAAVTAWRERGTHIAAQRQGRDGIFQAYRLRVGRVTRDYGMRAGERFVHGV